MNIINSPLQYALSRQSSNGRFWLPQFLIDGVSVRFEPLERDIFAALFNARGGIVPVGRLIQMAWPDAELQPINAYSSISVRLSILRTKLRRTRFRIVTHFGRGWSLGRIT